MSQAALSPVEAARTLHASLCAGRLLTPVTPPAVLPLGQDEWAFGVFTPSRRAALIYQRYCDADVVYYTNPAVVVGSPQFLIGYALGATVQRARLRRKARQLAQPQWRSLPLACTVVTNRRLWCYVDGQWVQFDYDTITGYALRGQALTLSFTRAVPLKITGAWAPWIAVAIAHLRYGTAVAARIPELDNI